MTPRELAQVANNAGEVAGYIKGLSGVADKLDAQASEWLRAELPKPPWWCFRSRRLYRADMVALGRCGQAMRDAAKAIRDQAVAAEAVSRQHGALLSAALHECDAQPRRSRLRALIAPWQS
jgi:hypothetical protein